MAAAFAQSGGHLVLGMAEFIHQLTIAGSLVHGIKIGALDVFNDRDLKDFGIGVIAHQHRNVMQLGHLRGTPAAFTSDDFIAIRVLRGLAHDQRLDDTFFRDGCCQLAQRVFGEGPAGLVRVRANPFDRNNHVGSWCACLRCFGLADIGHQSRQAPAQTARIFGAACHDAKPFVSLIS